MSSQAKDITSETTSTTEHSNSTDSNNAKNEVLGMKKVLMDSKVKCDTTGKQKSVWAMTLETFGMADGHSKGGDVVVETLEEGLEILNEHLQDKDRKLQETQNNDNEKKDDDPSTLCTSWMDLVPLNEFEATQDQFLAAFLKWATKDPDSANTSKKGKDKHKTGKGNINVSKARRRLDAYFEWMDANMAQNLKEKPLTRESIQAAAKVWDIQITYTNEGLFVWWVDIGALDKEVLGAMDSQEHLRYLVWFSHFVIFDAKAQDHGAMIIENLGRIGFWKMCTLVPMDLGAKLDRLTIGILPVKMKSIYVFGAAGWMNILMTMMKPFMGKKMRDRMVVVNDKKTDMQTYCDELVTRAQIPQGFCGLQGEARRDAFFK